MTINERVRYLRKNILHLSQYEFAARIGMKQTGVSSFEIKDGNVITDRTIKLICSEFGVNEEWLRNGKEPIFAPDVPVISLEEYVANHGGTELELRFFKAYLDLDPEIRDTVISHFVNALRPKKE